MNSEDRDRLLRRAWEFPPFDDRVIALSDIAQRIGPSDDVPPSAPTDLPIGVRALAEEARRESLAGGGGATHSPGEVVLRHAPDALRVLSRRFPQRCVLVSGTNGKTTTASMIAAILREDGRTVTHNRAGANMPAGVATALLEEPGEIGVFEVDEAWLPVVAAELSPGGDRARKPLPGPTRRVWGARCPGRVLGSDGVRRAPGPARPQRRRCGHRRPAAERRRERLPTASVLRSRGSRSGSAGDRARGRLDPLRRPARSRSNSISAS